jgi:hypothetical protein
MPNLFVFTEWKILHTTFLSTNDMLAKHMSV